MIEAKQTHCGQYKPYGDFFRMEKSLLDGTHPSYESVEEES